jgi:hypothetical protein
MHNSKHRGSTYDAAATELVTRKDVKSIALKPIIKYEHPVYTECSVKIRTTANREAAHMVQQELNLSQGKTLNQ